MQQAKVIGFVSQKRLTVSQRPCSHEARYLGEGGKGGGG